MSRQGIPQQTTPFARMAATHAVSAAGDAFITAALAGSLFFTASVDAARGRTILYLLFTMAPFAVIAPIIGPFLDRSRGGRKAMVFGTFLGRALMCILMAGQVDSVFLFPLAFGALVMQKSYSITKSALVPSVVDGPDDLVKANARLALIGVLGGTLGLLPAALVLKLVGAAWVLRLGAVVFLVGAVAALQLDRARSVAPDETDLERAELQTASVRLAVSGMGVLRGAIGFLTFLLAFSLKAAGEPAWFFGLVLGFSGLGGFVGAMVAPGLRRRIREESILVGSLLLPAVVCLFSARGFGRLATLAVAFAVALGASAGKLAFDSLIQRDAHDAARGRAFARFETRFQLVWVLGGLGAVVGNFGGRTGFLLLTLGLGFGGLSYIGGTRATANQASGSDDPTRRVSLDKRAPGRRRALLGRDQRDQDGLGLQGLQGVQGVQGGQNVQRVRRTQGAAGDRRRRRPRGVSAPIRDRSRRDHPGP